MIFSHAYIFYYVEFIMNLIFNVLAVVPLYLYTFKISFGDRRLWKLFLLVKIFFELTGHLYEVNSWKAMLSESWQIGTLAILSFIILRFPAYLACYRYAFEKE